MRRRALLIALTALIGILAPFSRADGVVGGGPASRPYRFMVSLQLANRQHLCGASLVHERWVLTAAHCVAGSRPKDFVVMLGSHRLSDPGPIFRVSRIDVHERWGDTGNSFDVALLRLRKPAPFRVIRIPAPAQRSVWEPGTEATAIGWGARNQVFGGVSDDLQEVEVPIVSDPSCAQAYPLEFDAETMVCAGELQGGGDTCGGDSGGPLLVPNAKGRLVIVGTVSWGRGCGNAGSYGVYGRVADSTLYPWIQAHLP